MLPCRGAPQVYYGNGPGTDQGAFIAERLVNLATNLVQYIYDDAQRSAAMAWNLTTLFPLISRHFPNAHPMPEWDAPFDPDDARRETTL